ncbi:methylthiotransferase [Actinidia rufa]|uniref:Methylthiotransferase n=1 Tax=Actinidia rufa TaxID=165716 RepID=A0A7J0EFZ5_9ERIC|nr:methylthiotransferase [Actinidia rufa]
MSLLGGHSPCVLQKLLCSGASLKEVVDYGQKGINTLLSLEETYADISPVRISKNSIAAFVSVMMWCNNMCPFCIVPFTRGREQSRSVESIVREVGELWKEGVKELFLAQNVNSYNDASGAEKDVESGATWQFSVGFSSMSKVKKKWVCTLLIYWINQAQSFQRYGSDKHVHILKISQMKYWSSTVRERMRWGYTREAYLDLVPKIRRIIPDAGLSSDFICGFFGETEEEHKDTLSLVKAVGYDMACVFDYSMREKTHAHRNCVDDVPDAVKQRRLTELIEAFHESTDQCFDSQIGTIQLVFAEGPNKRAYDTEIIGKIDRGHRVSFTTLPVPEQDD